MPDYPFIRAYGVWNNSNPSYVRDKITRAQQEGAPPDAWSYDTDEQLWRTVCDLDERAAAGNHVAAHTAETLRSFAELLNKRRPDADGLL